ncbi:MAG: undecaprenyl-diphosphate phosphatase [bacterium]|nr:MAG: undecaprenyl-diphosphate phosphatase [bacterium]
MAIGLAIIVLLAVIQGLTEFLPVSSSGHLVLAENLLGVRGSGGGTSVLFEVAVHVGTLGAILLIYRRTIRNLLAGLAAYVRAGFRPADESREEVGYIGWILLGSLPAAVVGFFLHDRMAAVFNSPRTTAVLLVVTGLFLLTSRIRTGERTLCWWIVLLIGAAQAVAILPGCSRSGWTITVALIAGLGFERAAEFSFLLSIPAIVGALALELVRGDAATLEGLSLLGLGIAAAVAFVSGWAALRLLLLVLRVGALHRFAYYLIPLGAVAFIYFNVHH